MKKNKDEKKCIGSKEFISFPELGKYNVEARIDTGAKTSSIHCERVWVQREKNKRVLCATLLRKTWVVTKFTKFELRKIKSSNGETEIRYKVKLWVEFCGDAFESEFTLSNRDSMTHAVLIGRKFLRGRYMVDVAYRFMHSSKKRSNLTA